MITLIEAQEYFINERLFAEKWLELEENKQIQSLNMARNQIDSLSLDRSIDLDNEADYKKAIFEQSLYLIETQGTNRSIMIEQGVTSFSVEGLSESYNSTNANKTKKICSEAMQYIKKYVIGSYNIC